MRTWLLALTIFAFGTAITMAGCSSSKCASDCTGTSSSDASMEASNSEAGDDAGSSGDAGKLPFGAACTTADQCAGNACVDFPAKGGKRCTEPCPAEGGACPNGCNNQGYCKVP